MMRKRPAFTLLELVMVILIIGILVVIVAISMHDTIGQSQEVAAARTVAVVRDAIQLHLTQRGGYPPDIDPRWLRGGRLENPYMPDHPTPVWVNNSLEKLYPVNKTLKPTSKSTFWYNRANGRFFARVPQQPRAADTIALFNRVNQSNVSALSETE